MKNVSRWFQQKPIPQLSMFCLIQGINDYVQINTFEVIYIVVRICIFINLASNILLLASKKCFLTSQGLVATGMNCRALYMSSGHWYEL
jgi:predicted CDP-diglyceride synthetase/phosphatidate cytidylyltransferase